MMRRRERVRRREASSPAKADAPQRVQKHGREERPTPYVQCPHHNPLRKWQWHRICHTRPNLSSAQSMRSGQASGCGRTKSDSGSSRSQLKCAAANTSALTTNAKSIDMYRAWGPKTARVSGEFHDQVGFNKGGGEISREAHQRRQQESPEDDLLPNWSEDAHHLRSAVQARSLMSATSIAHVAANFLRQTTALPDCVLTIT